MKDLFNHQNSMVFGVKKIQRRHCRAFLKDQIPNHILFSTIHRNSISAAIRRRCGVGVTADESDSDIFPRLKFLVSGAVTLGTAVVGFLGNTLSILTLLHR